MITIKTVASTAREAKAGKITCTTCKLKGCVGRCHFKVQTPSKAV